MNNMFLKYFYMGIFDGFLVKYGAVMLGYAVLGLPVFGPGSEEYIKRVEADPSRITADYIRNSSLLINLARAIGRIVTSYKELQKLAGYTSLVSQLQDVLDDLEHGSYERKMVEGEGKLPPRYKPGAGTIIDGADVIKFDKVPLVTPNGDLLVDGVSFEVTQTMNLMIVGPNGSGKSSLFRSLGELWPLFGGTITKPKFQDLFYISQKPYLVVGTLRDQVLFGVFWCVFVCFCLETKCDRRCVCVYAYVRVCMRDRERKKEKEHFYRSMLGLGHLSSQCGTNESAWL